MIRLLGVGCLWICGNPIDEGTGENLRTHVCDEYA